jgi:hypothetical protein
MRDHIAHSFWVLPPQFAAIIPVSSRRWRTHAAENDWQVAPPRGYRIPPNVIRFRHSVRNYARNDELLDCDQHA